MTWRARPLRGAKRRHTRCKRACQGYAPGWAACTRTGGRDRSGRTVCRHGSPPGSGDTGRAGPSPLAEAFRSLPAGDGPTPGHARRAGDVRFVPLSLLLSPIVPVAGLAVAPVFHGCQPSFRPSIYSHGPCEWPKARSALARSQYERAWRGAYWQTRYRGGSSPLHPPSTRCTFSGSATVKTTSCVSPSPVT